MIGTVLEWLVTSVFLILVVLALRAVLGRHVSAGLRYALWAVVLVRLLVPVQLFPSPLPAAVWPPELEPGPAAVTAPPALPSAPSSNVALGEPVIAAPLPGGAAVEPGAAIVPEDTAPKAEHIHPARVLGWVWLAGAAVMAAAFIVSNVSFAYRLRRVRVPLEGADGPLPVYRVDALPSPCLFGVLRPAVYVTEEAAADPAMLRHVLAHEHTHARHLDHIWNALRCAALAVHWWDPLVWLAAALSRRDCELACDEGALKRLGDGERAAYGRTLLALITAKPRPADLLRCATTMTGGSRSVWERVSRIARAPKRWLWAAVAVVLATVLACLCAFGSASERPQDEPDDPPPAPSEGLPSRPIDDLSFTEQGVELVLLNARVLDAAPDLNRNGVPETLTVGDLYLREDADLVRDEGADIEGIDLGVVVWEGGEMLWRGMVSYIHAGQGAFLLCSLDGADYLMEFDLHGGFGQAHGDYRLFTLENGVETTAQEDHVEFHYCTDSIASVKEHFDPDAVAAFVDTVDSLLPYCTVLADTTGSLQGDPLRVDMTWLEGYAPGLRWLEGLSTRENLVRFKLMAEHPSYARDLNGDMRAETIQISELDGRRGLRLELWANDTGTTVWAEEAIYAHAGQEAVFLCTLDDRDYLLRYRAYLQQGYAEYSYQLFTLTRDGQESIVREDSLQFNLNFRGDILWAGDPEPDFDPEAIAAFMDAVNGLLANSTMLINTDDVLMGTFERNGRLVDDLAWLDSFPEVYVRDRSRSLLENLRDFRRAMEGDWETGLRAVLRGKVGFLFQSEALTGWTDLSQVPALFDGGDPYTAVQSFALVDLDGDGTDEAVLHVWGVAGDAGGYLVLYRDPEFDRIDGRRSGYRSFWDLKADGTFQWSSPTGSSSGWGAFDLDTGGIDPIAYGEGPLGQDYDTFVVDGRSVTEAEYRAFSARQDAKPDAVWYDFTPENVTAALEGD